LHRPRFLFELVAKSVEPDVGVGDAVAVLVHDAQAQNLRRLQSDFEIRRVRRKFHFHGAGRVTLRFTGQQGFSRLTTAQGKGSVRKGLGPRRGCLPPTPRLAFWLWAPAGRWDRAPPREWSRRAPDETPPCRCATAFRNHGFDSKIRIPTPCIRDGSRHRKGVA